MVRKFGLRQQLALAVVISITFATLVICLTLYYFNQKRAFSDTVKGSEEMLQAAALSFSQAIEGNDYVLLDALLHELQSREHLYISEAYVILPDGRIMAHSVPEEYGKTYPVPKLLTSTKPSRLSEVATLEKESFSVVSLLQFEGYPVGALVVSFSTKHIFQKALYELLWIIIVTVPVLIVAGIGVFSYGERIVGRLDTLKEKALGIGRGEWGGPLEVRGDDEISHLAGALNHMYSDIVELRKKDLESAERINALNTELTGKLSQINVLKEQLAEENIALRNELNLLHEPGEIIGSNSTLRELIAQARQVASLPVTVLITGESGTGKELIARYLHEAGSRSKALFTIVNCAALPTTLIENELFGHEKGAFTGADSKSRGKFEMADGGTIFLDEVGEIPLEAQSKLLRVLQLGEFTRVGGEEQIKVDVRVIAATNKELHEEVEKRSFREDLYYRLKVVELTCPPLRDRREDLPALVQHFIEIYSRKLEREVLGVSPSALEQLANYNWPGNIRELENMTARAVALTDSKVLGPADFNLGRTATRSPEKPSEASEVGDFERLLGLCGLNEEELSGDGWEKIINSCESICLKAALDRGGNQKKAAEVLGLTETKFHRLKKKHRLERKSGESPQKRFSQFQK